ncbi:MAG TPA: phosphomannomutase [Candidatus Saccharibacteria bacterium]|nr:phosphomannomutase [Candidatus Saccharibacteria bacterium]
MPTLREALIYEPAELSFGTSGLRGLVTDMTDLECYINVRGFLNYINKSSGQVYTAGDLRFSTPRILAATHRAIIDAGCEPVFCGFIPTPAVALYGLKQGEPSIMVTGSHIPDDRNGIKFNKADGEVLKADEVGINQAVLAVREALYAEPADEAAFGADGAFQVTDELPEMLEDASHDYLERYLDAFPIDAFRDKTIVLYEHSAVGRDLIKAVLKRLGATVIPVGRSERFIPIDTENVTVEDQRYFKELSEKHQPFAIVSTDGDSDRPFVIDENGVFHRGDELGAVVAEALEADFAAYPITSSDGVDTFLADKSVPAERTRVGSPYVIVAMQEAQAAGRRRTVGWEANGGFLVGNDTTIYGKPLMKLPTRDALLPILVALYTASQRNSKVSDVFAELPQRFTQAGIIDNFPPEVSRAILAYFADGNEARREELGQYFTSEDGFGAVTEINSLDGLRLYFDNGDIAHIRPSGNAPQLRIYSVADSQERADEVVGLALKEPDGIYRRLEERFGH